MVNYIKWYIKNSRKHLAWWLYFIIFTCLCIFDDYNTIRFTLSSIYFILSMYSLYIKYIEYYLYKIPIINGDSTSDILEHINDLFYKDPNNTTILYSNLLYIDDIYKILKKPKNMFKYKKITKDIIFEYISNNHIEKYEYIVRDSKLQELLNSK